MSGLRFGYATDLSALNGTQQAWEAGVVIDHTVVAGLATIPNTLASFYDFSPFPTSQGPAFVTCQAYGDAGFYGFAPSFTGWSVGQLDW